MNFSKKNENADFQNKRCDELSFPVLNDISKWIEKEGTIKNEKVVFDSNLILKSNVLAPKIDVTNKIELRKCVVKIKRSVQIFPGDEKFNISKKIKCDKQTLPTKPCAMKVNDHNSLTNLSQISCPSILKLIGLQPFDSSIKEKIKEKQCLKNRCLTRSTLSELYKGRDFYDIIEQSKKSFTTKCTEIHNYETTTLQALSKNHSCICLCNVDVDYQSTKDKVESLISNQSTNKMKNGLQPGKQQNNIYKNENSIKLRNFMKDIELTNDKEISDHLLFEISLRELIDKVKRTDEITFLETKPTVLNLLETSLSKLMEERCKKNKDLILDLPENISFSIQRNIGQNMSKENYSEINQSPLNSSEIEGVEPLKMCTFKSNTKKPLLTIILNNLAPKGTKVVVTKENNVFEVIGVDKNI